MQDSGYNLLFIVCVCPCIGSVGQILLPDYAVPEARAMRASPFCDFNSINPLTLNSELNILHTRSKHYELRHQLGCDESHTPCQSAG